MVSRDFATGLPERERNPLLRRVDWRYLLPDPVVCTATCFAGGSIARGVHLVAHRLAEPHEQGASDLAVACGPGSDTLRAAWSALRPGGTLYAEAPALGWGGAARARRQLEAAGFEPIAAYRPWPRAASGRVKFWIPLGSPEAAQYFFEQHLLVRFPLLRHASRWAGALWRKSLTSPFLPSVCIVARKRSPEPRAERVAKEGAGALPEHLAEVLREGWERWGFGCPPERWSWLLLTLGPRAISKVVGVVLADGDPSPRLVVKLARVPEAAAGIRREARTLATLGQRMPDGRSGVPRFLFLHEGGELPFLGEEALVGAPLWRRLRRGNVRELAFQATDWLADFARSSPSFRQTLSSERIATPVFQRFCGQFGSVVESRLLQQTESALTRLPALPIICEQRDFSPWNVLLGERGRLQVLDWESAEPDGLPLLDLVYFLAYLGFFAHGALSTHRLREHYRGSLDASTPFGRLRAECIARYCAATGLDPELVRPLSILTWLIHTHSEFGHFTSDAAGAPAASVLGRSIFAGLWEEELRRGAGRGGKRP